MSPIQATPDMVREMVKGDNEMAEEQFAELKVSTLGRRWQEIAVDVLITFIGVFGALLLAKVI